ncbi:External alternative NAD(P)H-ubiquinone oxidoreductase B1, mitochondrial [Sphaceloma murrayae]|uniref:External alternative NAD(P)H-ubiquinone oxidoreductase B1, mitochondrial n=1 Tax=Sphaceloma murrayae TaxID=2082308 RepID=A0A2K1QRT6_9PEZI|nr:External alternative NAD(P)H-ubiquinone oxidoreductase B1, mitochondrial [Sphaceloma murrayae]
MNPSQLQCSVGGLRFARRRAQTAKGTALATQLLRPQLRCMSIKQLDDSRKGRERIVILGSGWAGYTLSRSLSHSKYQVIVVSPRSYFVFTPLLASTSVGTLEFRNALEPVRSRRNATEFFQGWADNVDFEAKKLLIEEAVHDPQQGLALTGEPASESKSGEKYGVKNGELIRQRKGDMFEMAWDKLVIAVGCYSQTFGTKGVKEHAFFLKDVGDARRIRNRMLACFETASLPTTSEEMRKALLHFAVVGGGPTGIEFSAELHDLVKEDLARLYPDLIRYHKITVYDVAPQILSMFDQKLGQYAIDTFRREGIQVHTSTHIEELRPGLPSTSSDADSPSCFTLKITEEGEVPVGMCVWSTGLMMNPFIQTSLDKPIPSHPSLLQEASDAALLPPNTTYTMIKHPKTGAIQTNSRLEPLLTPTNSQTPTQDQQSASMTSVFALGDCASIATTPLPATAQVANQKAKWLAKHLNNDTVSGSKGFTFRDLGVMAYIGNWKAIMQSQGADISGLAAWIIWRGAYLAKTVSWRNRILIATYWAVNWVFGRDISRF